MAAVFDSEGFRFHYPENWKLAREDGEEGWTVSLQSPGTAFMMITVREDLPSADEVADATLAALREEYSDLEAKEAMEPICGQPAVGHDIHFFSFDLTNSCWTRSFYTARGTVMVLAQVNDLELESAQPVFRAICASLSVEDE